MYISRYLKIKYIGICFALFGNFPIRVGPIFVTIDLSNICTTFGLVLNNCNCRNCPYTPTDAVVKFVLNSVDIIIGNNMHLVPCNPDNSCVGACSGKYSTISPTFIF